VTANVPSTHTQTYRRSGSWPLGVRIGTDEALALAKTVDECGVDFGWEIFAKDAIRRGRGSVSLAGNK